MKTVLLVSAMAFAIAIFMKELVLERVMPVTELSITEQFIEEIGPELKSLLERMTCMRLL